MFRPIFPGLQALFRVRPSKQSQAQSIQYARLSGPAVYDNVAIYFVHDTTETVPVPLTLEEAVAGGAVSIHETGTVNQLQINNGGATEVFVQAGDLVKGGLQDRVLSADLLLPPRSGEVVLTVFCVESGRWRARGAEDVGKFSSAKSAMPSHAAKVKMRAAAPWHKESGWQAGPTQAEIWAEVHNTQSKLAKSVGASVRACASLSSLQLSLETNELNAARAPFSEALRGAGDSSTDTVGATFMINGKIRSSDIYASNALFRKMWPKLLSAAAADAISEKDAPATVAPTLDAVQTFLRSALSLPESERRMNHHTRLATRQDDDLLYAELRRADGTWVHRNYLALEAAAP